MLKLYTDESPGLRVDPVVVLVLSLGFIFSVVGLHGEFFFFFFLFSHVALFGRRVGEFECNWMGVVGV